MTNKFSNAVCTLNGVICLLSSCASHKKVNTYPASNTPKIQDVALTQFDCDLQIATKVSFIGEPPCFGNNCLEDGPPKLILQLNSDQTALVFLINQQDDTLRKQGTWLIDSFCVIEVGLQGDKLPSFYKYDAQNEALQLLNQQKEPFQIKLFQKIMYKKIKS